MSDDHLESGRPSAVGRAQLRRLRTFVDVVFALMLWHFASYLPTPASADWSTASLAQFLADNAADFEIVVVGVLLVVIYWLQNNALFGNLTHTDNRHTTYALLQVFALLVYGYTVALGIAFDGDRVSLALQSVAAAALGFIAGAGWSYARRGRRLLDEEITEAQANNLQVNTLVEPVTALITLAAAPFGATAWTLAWLTYPLVRRVLVRRVG